MPIFISYSQKDAAFVDQLALQLVQHRVNVWLDRWELKVGDSLLTRIQEAISGASALIVVLSKSSAESAWVQKEMNSGLLRELEENRVVVLPALIEDCTIPVFMREKLYADFRSDFDSGLQSVLEGIASVLNAYTARIDAPEYHSDWAFDWGTEGGCAAFRIAFVEQAQDQPYTVLGLVEVCADAVATKSYKADVQRAGEESAHLHVVSLVLDAVTQPEDLVLLLEDQHEQTAVYEIQDSLGKYRVRVSARRLGRDTGRSVLYRAGQQIRELYRHMTDATMRPRGDS